MNDKNFAVLIDSDNISARYIDCIMDEMTKYGTVTYRRIYGDFTSTQMNHWREKLTERSITPIQQFQNTTGKNATDSALIIDAMDILYTGNVQGFCLVSSDSDFTRLASRLRESGMEVIGMGEEKTPKSFRAACSMFTNIELLLNEDTEKENESQEKKNVVRKKKIADAIIQMIMSNESKGKDTGLGEVGSVLLRKYSDFDVRNYGYNSLSRFIEDMNDFELKKKNSSIYILLKNSELEIQNTTKKIVEKAGGDGIDIGRLAEKVYECIPDFTPKKMGYATFLKFLKSIPDIEVKTGEKNQKFAILKNGKLS